MPRILVLQLGEVIHHFGFGIVFVLARGVDDGIEHLLPHRRQIGDQDLGPFHNVADEIRVVAVPLLCGGLNDCTEFRLNFFKAFVLVNNRPQCLHLLHIGVSQQTQ